MSFRSMSRQPQLQTYTNIHKRPTFRGPQPNQRKNMSVASSSVYDPDETAQRNVKLTLKQAITLITLRLGRLEVMANETRFGGKDSENSVDKEFLLSLVTRMDNMEKDHHNLRVEVEKNRQTLCSLDESLENLDIQDEPIILEIIEKLDNLSKAFETEKPEIESDAEIEPETEEVEPVPEVEVVEVIQVVEVVESVPEVETPVQEEKPKKKRGKKVVI